MSYLASPNHPMKATSQGPMETCPKERYMMMKGVYVMYHEDKKRLGDNPVLRSSQ